MFSVALLLLLAAGSCVNCEQLTQPASVTVQPGQRLTITCQVSYSLNSKVTAWIRQPAGKGLEWIGRAGDGWTTYYKDSLRNKFSISLDSSSKTVTLNGENVQPEDTAVYYCARGDYAFDYWGKGTMVTVTSASSSRPTLFPLIPCGSDSGDMVTLGCLATGFNPPSLTFSWTKQDIALTDFIQYPAVQKGDTYYGASQIRVRRQDWTRDQFKCAVTHTAGGGQTPVNPEMIFRKNATLKVFSSSDEDGNYTFSCFAKEFAPKEHVIKWQKNGEDITSKTGLFSIVSEPIQTTSANKVYNAASFLTVNELSDNPRFSCLFEGGDKQSLNKSVTYKEGPVSPQCSPDMKIEIISPTTENMLLNKKGTVTCQVKAENKGLSITWENEQGKEILGGPMSKVNGNGKTYNSELDITFDEWTTGVKRFCVVHHEDLMEPLKKPYERKFGGSPKRPAVFMLPPLEHKREVTLTCYVKDFFPKEVYVSWLVNDEEADSSAFNTTEPIENSRLYSAYSQLFVSLEDWQTPDAVYNCVVYHESVVNTTKAIVRSVGYKTFENTNLVNLNMNIPETCKAQ